jgi:hypothetical protein
MVVRKRFGQHFLHDPAVIRRIVDRIAPAHGRAHRRESDRGAARSPGLCWSAPESLDAIEIDRDLARSLTTTRAPTGGCACTSRTSSRPTSGGCAPQARRLRVVGNLPYNISTPVLFRLLAQRAAIADMHFMLQKEVVDRMAAAPGGKEYGRLTVMLAAHAEVAERCSMSAPARSSRGPRCGPRSCACVRVSGRASTSAMKVHSSLLVDRRLLSSTQDSAQRLERPAERRMT